MKNYLKLFMSLAVLVMMSVTSCVEDGLRENPADEGCKEIPALSEQVKAIEMSLSDLSALEAALDNESEMENVIESVESHISALRSGMPWGEGTVATMEQQKKLAHAVGAIKASHNGNQSVEAAIKSLEASAKVWLGKNLDALYPIAAAQAETDAVIAGLNLGMQKIKVDGIASDLEAGLRKGASLEDVAALAASVEKNISESEKLSFSIAKMVSDVEDTYRLAIQSVVENPSDFKSSEVKSVNKSAAAMLKSSETNLQSLISRVEICESSLADLAGRVGKLETDIQDLEELLNMIQSVTFMSEYSEEYAVAYYTMGYDDDPTQGSGIKKRTPDGTISLSYLVRPASAAAALATQSLWNDGLRVMSYYAQSLETKSVSLTGETITNVTADSQTGMVTVTIQNNLENNFFYKKVGAKMALSISSGKTDITSKFVEIVPKDKSGKVYLKNLTLSKDEVEIDEGDELNLYATVAPDDVYDRELVWTSSNNDIVSVSGAGRITGNAVGTATVTVTSKATDEWGKTMSATCSVKVNPAIKLSGPSYVEEGKNAELTLDFPPAMVIESKVWMSSDENKATVSNDGVVSGVAHTYNEYTLDYNTVTITCIVNGSITLTHDMKVVVPQPTQVKFNEYADNVSEITMKLDQTVSLAGTVLPAEASTNFRLFYDSTAGTLGWIDSSSGLIKGSSFVGDVTVYARVFEIDKHHRFAPGKSLTRAVTVKAEPYWVESVTLPATLTLAPDATATLTPTFTSDVSGKQPTNTSLTWSSSNPSIVSINSTTGEMIAHSVGTVQITATTVSGAASGSEQKSANCIVTVKTPVAPIAIGDYFYSDGTWSTERDNSKTVIGIVFATVNATGTDSHLRADYPECTNGLVVSTVEYTSKCVADKPWSYADMAEWCYSNGYTSYWDQSNTCGYSNTKGYLAVNAANVISYGYTIDFTLFNSTSPVVTHRNSVSVPTSTSAWYVPSYKEMQLLYENRAIVNERITAVGGTGLHVTRINYDDNQYRYWTSTYDLEGKVVRTFNMMDSGGGAWYSSTGGETTSFPVRIILAF